MSLPDDNFGRHVVLTTVDENDIYTITSTFPPYPSGYFTLSFPTSTPLEDVYNSINSMWPDGYVPPIQPSSDITTITTNTYIVLSSDNTINVDTNTINSMCTLTLPLISTIGQKRYFITDISGKAGIYNIRVIPSGSDTIIGTNSVTINSNYSSISMYNDEVSNWILY